MLANIKPIQPVELAETHAVLSPTLGLDEWSELLHSCVRMARACQWWIGDLVIAGEHRWGEVIYQYLSDLTEADYETIRGCVWVAERIPPAERCAELSWTHHRVVAAIDDPALRTQLLEQAREHCWTTRELAAAVRALRAQPLPATDAEPPSLASLDEDWQWEADEQAAIALIRARLGCSERAAIRWALLRARDLLEAEA
ncbi:MAG: hypothetical protein IRY83_15010 [Chloroflexi bacterium]|nr:hypothetical protein [Chloroflexota bacterium]